ncbi:MAG: transglutaminase domain-containing protein [Bacteroides sp.]|nr:transglutaminase domain-containing protein [Bacteroides sp.]
MKATFRTLFLAGILLCTACGKKHLIMEDTERQRVLEDYAAKKRMFPSSDFQSVFDFIEAQEMPEREALQFLYAYMPIGDIADYSPGFYLQNIQSSFQAKQEMPWGKTIPEREFRHFVLPVRVNNENLDSCRTAFYAELKDRVKNLSLYDAVLEVNHWCHEKATYSPSDMRTSSPLATVKTAYGRCGEESTLLVAALRSVCIPARQVYTPRWAHTDDNHAWVEAYVDGQWHFLGACEPEPVLDLAWFNKPATRGMLMHTKVFGRYTGPEEVMAQTPLFTEINVTANYADTASIRVLVRDVSGNPLPGLKVEFKLYNYAEFYPVAVKFTDGNGLASLTAGKGDMLVWAEKDGRFGFQKASFGKDKDVTLVLDRTVGEEFSTSLDMVPPALKRKEVEVSETQRLENRKRLQAEDSLRNLYTATFYNKQTAAARGRELGLPEEEAVKVLTGCRGNRAVIDTFLQNAPDHTGALNLLLALSEKDWRDISLNVLQECLNQNSDNISYVCNPRVEYEQLVPYRTYFKTAFPLEFSEKIRHQPEWFAHWVNDSIALAPEYCLSACPISPIGVYKARKADAKSRSVFFVSVLRAHGIPARIEPVTGQTQYSIKNGVWKTVFAPAESHTENGCLQLEYQGVRLLPNPEYYGHFTLSRHEEDGFRLQTYPEDGSVSYKSTFSKPQHLNAGHYLLVSGTRLAGGEVLAQLRFFNVTDDRTTRIPLTMRDDPDRVKVIGNFNAETRYFDMESGSIKSILQRTGRGYFVLAVLGSGQEPTNHALRDLSRLKVDLEAWNRPFLGLFTDPNAYRNYTEHPFENLPATMVFGIDQENAVVRELAQKMDLQAQNLPLFIICDTFNRVVFASQGYNINLGELLLKTIRQL